MATATKSGPKKDVYLELIAQVPLRPIRSEAELDRAIAMVDGLLDREDLDRDAQDYLDVLSDLIERYESEAHPIPPVSDAEMLRHLIEAKGVTQAEVARDTGIAESTISEILVGKRSLNRAQIGKLACYFRVGPGVFTFEAFPQENISMATTSGASAWEGERAGAAAAEYLSQPLVEGPKMEYSSPLYTVVLHDQLVSRGFPDEAWHIVRHDTKQQTFKYLRDWCEKEARAGRECLPGRDQDVQHRLELVWVAFRAAPVRNRSEAAEVFTHLAKAAALQVPIRAKRSRRSSGS